MVLGVFSFIALTAFRAGITSDGIVVARATFRCTIFFNSANVLLRLRGTILFCIRLCRGQLE